MSIHTFTGRLTNAQRLNFLASRNAQFFAVPKQPGVGVTGHIHDDRIPITVDLATGEYSVRLEASNSVRPPMPYQFVCEWQRDGQNHWSVWAEFFAPPMGGAIGDMTQLPPNPGTWSYGWGKPNDPKNNVTQGIYVDLDSPGGQWYGEEGSVV
ncbi:hypothetical protein [Leucobacter tenebrionis]|uniref:hypothetical protein n=1 Tax=Leucobacter tenebrionis TaxID=2873270 RepID=UPI001CA70909|nr:hypothetical protein [Leucobacter tenebrionis]QZY52929.1 hypothetical protein KVY00_05705 [Leucobacter tenebrionis]